MVLHMKNVISVLCTEVGTKLLIKYPVSIRNTI